MEKPWRISVFGVRGTAPAPGEDTRLYGGHTCCILAECGGAAVVLDAGSGLAPLGAALRRRGIARADLLLSHLHLDHLLGFMNFGPLFDPDFRLHLYGAAGLEKGLRGLLAPPYWPVGPDQFSARLQFHEFAPGARFSLAPGAPQGVAVSTLSGCHPGGSCLYRLGCGGRSLVYGLDCELQGPMARQLAAFARGADLLVWDASFAPGALRPGWGHSSWQQGVQVAAAAGAKRVLMTHYHPGFTDSQLEEQAAAARRMDGRCLFAREGMVIEL